MKPIRLYITLVCTLLLLLQGGGMLLYYTASQSIQQTTMKTAVQSLPDEELCTLRLSVHQFESARLDKHELLLDQQKYDIKSYQLAGDSVLVVAYRDIEEEESMHGIALLLHGKEDSQAPPSKLFHFFLSEFLPASIGQSFHNYSASLSTHQDGFQATYLLGYFNLNLPPPKST